MHFQARKFIIHLLLLCQMQFPVMAYSNEDPKDRPNKTTTGNPPEVSKQSAPTTTAPPPSTPEFWETDHGRVTVGKPKIWQFDRVNSTIDGLLRDVDSVTLAKLEDMNPSESNQTMIDFLTTSLNIKAGFNQGTGAINALEMERVNAQRPTELQRLQSFNEMQQLAAQRRLEVYRQLIAARDRRAKLDPQSATFTDDKDALDKTVTALETELTEIEKIAKETPPSVTTVDPKQFQETQAPEISNPLTQVFNSADLKSKLLENLKASLPATKRLDNFITLLHERLSRELSISYDDIARQKKEIYLVQFDVGIYPQGEAANHVLRVEFDLAEDGHERPLAYDLYPGASSYNMTEFWGKSRGTGIVGTATFLAGLGLSGEYKRQRDQVRSAITQSVYIAGFGAGTTNFGWYFGTNPFEKLISPGNRTAYAVVLLDKETAQQKKQRQQQGGQRELILTPRVKWLRRTEDKNCPAMQLNQVRLTVPEPSMKLNRLAYQTKYSPPSNQGQNDTGGQNTTPEFGTVQLTFDEPIDPNLVVTVNGAVLPRLRDVRGRAVARSSASTDTGNAGPKTSTFGLLEVDIDTDSHWFALDSKSISLKLAKTLAGSEGFPRIRLLQAGSTAAQELRALLNPRGAQVVINDWIFNVANDPLPPSAFVPMFSTIEAIDDLEAWVIPNENKIKIVRKTASSTYAPLDEYAQVVLLSNSPNASNPRPLLCTGYQPLICQMASPVGSGKHYIAVERAPSRTQNGIRWGFTGRKELRSSPPAILTSDYEVEPVTEASGEIRGWLLRVHAENLQVSDKVEGFDALTPVNIRALLNFARGHIQFDATPQYRFTGNDGSGIYDGIEFWLPVTQLAAVVRSRLYLSRGTERLFDLPQIAPKLLPVVSELRITSQGYALRGVNLGLVEQIELRGCREACPPSQRSCREACNNIPLGVSSDVIGFAAPTVVSGVFPIFLHLRSGVVVEAAKGNGETLAVDLLKKEQPQTKASAGKARLATPPPPPPPQATPPSTTEQKSGGRNQILPPPKATPPTQEKDRRYKQTTIQ